MSYLHCMGLLRKDTSQKKRWAPQQSNNNLKGKVNKLFFVLSVDLDNVLFLKKKTTKQKDLFSHYQVMSIVGIEHARPNAKPKVLC